MFCLLSYHVGYFSCASVFDLLTPVIFKVTCSDLVWFPKFFRLKALFDLIALGLCFFGVLALFYGVSKTKNVWFSGNSGCFCCKFSMFLHLRGKVYQNEVYFCSSLSRK